METSVAESRLRQLLLDAGFSFERPDPLKAWEVFKRFVREPVDCADDGVLFECGVYDFMGQGDRFYFSFVRQFSIDVNGEYDHMEQLRCEFSCPPVPQSTEICTNLWLYDYAGNYDQYFKAVESLPQFQHGAIHAGWECTLEQEWV